MCMKTLLSTHWIGLMAVWTALAGLSVGCTDRGSIDPEPENPLQVGIITQIAERSYAVDRWSKISVDDAAKTTSFTPNDEIGVYLVEFNMANTAATDLLSKGNQTDNHKYTYNGTAWTAANLSNPLTWRKFNAFAYHPYSASVTDALAIKHTVRTDQSAAIAASDYLMWSGRSAEVTPVKGDKFSLNFTHKLTRLIVNVSLPSTYIGATVTGISEVKTLAFPVGTTLNLLTGLATAEANKGQVKMFRSQGAASDRTGRFEALVVPTTVAAYQQVVQIDYTTSTGTGTLYYYAPAGGIAFAENQIYTLTLEAKELIFLPELTPFISSNAPDQTTTVVSSDLALEWNLKSNDPWITFSINGGTSFVSEIKAQKGTSPVAVLVRVANNTTGQTRLGSLSLSSTDPLYATTARDLVVRQD